VNDAYHSLVFPLSGTKCTFVKRPYNLRLMLFVATEAGELFVFEVLVSFYLVHFFLSSRATCQVFLGVPGIVAFCAKDARNQAGDLISL
jgi:hypothetical protein